MYQEILGDRRFFGFLFACDEELAEKVREGGCPCGQGRLHQANYERKPRGGPEGLGREGHLRHSFCCDREGCRSRKTPPSLRFLSRHVYFGAVVLLVSAMERGPSRSVVRALRDLVGVSRRTLRRWRLWWQELFPRSGFWAEARGLLSRPVSSLELPLALLDLFPGDLSARVESLLRFLSPLSALSPLGGRDR